MLTGRTIEEMIRFRGETEEGATWYFVAFVLVIFENLLVLLWP